MSARIGLGTGYDPALSVRDFAEAVREVDRRGWEIAFFSETIGQLINTSVEHDRDRAVDAVRWEVASKFLPGKFASQAGPRLRVGEPHLDPALVPELEAAHRRGGPDAVARALPASMVQALTAAGTADDVLARIQRYRDAGVTLPIVRPAAPGQTRRIIDLFSPR